MSAAGLTIFCSFASLEHTGARNATISHARDATATLSPNDRAGLETTGLGSTAENTTASRPPSFEPVRWSLLTRPPAASGQKPALRRQAPTRGTALLSLLAARDEDGDDSTNNGSVTIAAADWEEIKGIWAEWDQTMERLERHDAEQRTRLAALRLEVDALRNKSGAGLAGGLARGMQQVVGLGSSGRSAGAPTPPLGASEAARPVSDDTIGTLAFMLFSLAMSYLLWQIYLTYQQHWHYEQKLQYQLVTGQNA